MDVSGICLNCFSHRGDFDVCPYCGYVAGTAPREAYLLHPGVVLASRYVIGTVLGIGGFGVTYKAWDTKLNILVAIKEFYPAGLVNRIPGESRVMLFSGEKQQSFSQQLERFLDEARNMAKFSAEKNIVNVFDFFEENETAYIVMEYLDGQTLKEHMAERGGRLEAEEAMAIAKGLLAAVENIHQKGIVHRDISPDNIFILHDGRVKVLDFGAARFAANENAQVTQSVVIKLGYAPPEQYRTNMKQGAWTDIYAVGATLYKMLTGITPDESVDRIERDTLRRPSQMGIMTAPNVEKAIMKAMALKPELRFKSAEQMLAALEDRASVDFPEEELKKRKRTRAVLIVLAVAAMLGIGAFAGYQGTQGGVETLADIEILPDSIVVAVPEYEEELAAVLTEQARSFAQSNPDYAVQIRTMGGDYAREVLDAGGPTVYLASPLSLGDMRKGADLSLLIDSLNRGSYWHLDKYESYYPGKTALPTGLRLLTAYGNEVASGEQEIQLPERLSSLDNLLQYGAQERAGVWGDDMGYLLHAFHPDLIRDNEVNLSASAFADATSLLGGVEAGAIDLSPSLDDSLTLYVGWTDEIRAVQAAWPGYYSVIPLLDGNAPYALFMDEWSVNPGSSENQQKIGMLFLHFLLSDSSQNMLYVQRDSYMPLNKSTMELYLSINPDLDFLSGTLSRAVMHGESGFAIAEISGRLRDALEGGFTLESIMELIGGQ